MPPHRRRTASGGPPWARGKCGKPTGLRCGGLCRTSRRTTRCSPSALGPAAAVHGGAARRVATAAAALARCSSRGAAACAAPEPGAAAAKACASQRESMAACCHCLEPPLGFSVLSDAHSGGKRPSPAPPASAPSSAVHAGAGARPAQRRRKSWLPHPTGLHA
eukprot:10558969-Alexandrium_andersonii.AAC.1